MAYYCPMHCEGNKTYPQPGSCPKCGMDLVLGESAYDDKEGLKAYQRLIFKFKIALAFSLPLFFVSMGDMLPELPENLFRSLLSLASTRLGNWLQFFFTLPVVFYAGWMFFVKAWKSIITWQLNMFTLIGIGAGSAFAFSVLGLFFPEFFPNDFKTSSGSLHLYFEATSVILTLVLLGQVLEAKAYHKTSEALKGLFKLAPSTATLIVDDSREKVIPLEEVSQGDLLRVKPGEKIPVDGVIKKGNGTIDEAMITGEAIPVSKKERDKVYVGTINRDTSFIMLAEKIGEATLLGNIIAMVKEASHSKAPIQKLVDKVAGYFVPLVLVIGLVTFFVWSIWGPQPSKVYGFINALAVLLIACPCALGLATPVSIMLGVGKGADLGILIKNAEALEVMNKVNVLVLDKTGTITEGKPSVRSFITRKNYDKSFALSLITSLSQHSEHPLAKAITIYGKAKSNEILSVTDFKALPGKGMKGKLVEKQEKKISRIALGNKQLLKDLGIAIPQDMLEKANALEKNGETVSYLAYNQEVIGITSLFDAIKPSSQKAIATLQKKGITVIMLTGDNYLAAKKVADDLAITNFQAECLPQDKLAKVEALQQQKKIVAVVGDGVNDSPALAKANLGIAMGSGTEVAIENAGITLMKDDLLAILQARKLSHKVMKNIRENLFFAFFYNSLGIPIAAGVLFPFWGLLMSPMLAAAAMSLSSVSVIANSLKLNKVNLKELETNKKDE